VTDVGIAKQFREDRQVASVELNRVEFVHYYILLAVNSRAKLEKRASLCRFSLSSRCYAEVGG
jgi:hypothetical protein